MELIYFLLIGALAGWLSGQIMQGAGFGILGNILVGVVGAVIGGWLFDFLGIYTEGSLLGSLASAVAGAIVLIWIARLIRK